MFLAARYCAICRKDVDKNYFPLYGNVCYNCEVLYNGSIATNKGQVSVMGRQKDVFASAKGSGHFPLTFNFVRRKDGRYIQCSYCGAFIHYKEITRDHVYPKSKDGLIKTPACKPCNERKEDMLPIEFALFAHKYGIDVAVVPIGVQEDVKEYYYNDIFLLLHSLKNMRENEKSLTVVM